MTKPLNHALFLSFLVFALLFASGVKANQAPVANRDKAVILYLPTVSTVNPELHTQLQQALNEQGLPQIVVKNVDFWHPYQQGLRAGRPGIYFAQPHFTAWAIEQHGFNPVYKLHGRLKYVLASRRTDSHLFEVNDLAGGVICREPGLNLGTVWINSVLGQYRLTAQSKEVESVEQAMTKGEKKCDAFIIDDYAYDRVNNGQLGRYIRLKQSPVYKHNAFIAHPTISGELLATLQKALKSRKVKALIKPYLNSLSKWQNLLPVKEGDYSSGDYDLLNAYWGSEK